MKQAYLVSLVAAALAIGSSWAAENQSTNLDNTILSLALADAYPNGG